MLLSPRLLCQLSLSCRYHQPITQSVLLKLSPYADGHASFHSVIAISSVQSFSNRFQIYLFGHQLFVSMWSSKRKVIVFSWDQFLLLHSLSQFRAFSSPWQLKRELERCSRFFLPPHALHPSHHWSQFHWLVFSFLFWFLLAYLSLQCLSPGSLTWPSFSWPALVKPILHFTTSVVLLKYKPDLILWIETCLTSLID